jgi:RNA polymerase sigma factor (sigma-70 family)
MTAPTFHDWLTYHFGGEDDEGASRPGRTLASGGSDATRLDGVARAAEDELLWHAVRSGDATRFAEWYDAMYNDSYRFASHFLRDGDHAADVVQDVFLSIWDRRAVWEFTGSARAYVFAAIRRRALQVIRHARIVTRVHEDARAHATETLFGNVPPGMGAIPSPPDSHLLAEDLGAVMARYIAELPERQRSALALRWQHGHANAEIAQILGVGEPAVSRLLARATATLRAVWETLVR